MAFFVVCLLGLYAIGASGVVGAVLAVFSWVILDQCVARMVTIDLPKNKALVIGPAFLSLLFLLALPVQKLLNHQVIYRQFALVTRKMIVLKPVELGENPLIIIYLFAISFSIVFLVAYNLRYLEKILRGRAVGLWSGIGWLVGVYLVVAIPIMRPGDTLLTTLGIGAAIGTGLIAATRLLSVWNPRPGTPPGRWNWLGYSAMIASVWCVYLLVFWPGAMSDDAVDQWGQVISGLLNSAHPVGHTLLIGLITRIWFSPASVIIVQILTLSLLVGWELGVLRRRGLPNWAAWLVTGLFAFSPVTGAMQVTLWKDVFYSTALLGLSFMALNLALDPTRWFARRWNWLWVGLLAAMVVLMRHNGLAVAPVVLLALVLAYPRAWRIFAGAFAVMICLWAFFQWPITALIKVQTNIFSNAAIGIHHIAAHIKAGDALAPADQSLVENVLPLDQWETQYYCYVVNPLTFNKEVDNKFIDAHLNEINALALRLFLQNPMVDIRHASCAGSLVTRVLQPAETYLYTVPIRRVDGAVHYVAPNGLGVTQASLLPGMAEKLTDLLDWTNTRSLLWFWWRPALYLYLFLLCGVVFMLRQRSWRPGLFLVGGVVQSGVLFLATIAQDFRYQYPVYLLGLFAVALLFLPASRAAEAETSPAQGTE